MPYIVRTQAAIRPQHPKATEPQAAPLSAEETAPEKAVYKPLATPFVQGLQTLQGADFRQDGYEERGFLPSLEN